jgi:hypothetical protein
MINKEANACWPNNEPLLTSTSKPTKKAIPKLNSFGIFMARNISNRSDQSGLYIFNKSGVGIRIKIMQISIAKKAMTLF